jgi:hypothetical protein
VRKIEREKERETKRERETKSAPTGRRETGVRVQADVKVVVGPIEAPSSCTAALKPNKLQLRGP